MIRCKELNLVMDDEGEIVIYNVCYIEMRNMIRCAKIGMMMIRNTEIDI